MKTRPALLEDALPIAEVHIASWRVAYAGLLAPEHLSSLSVEDRARKWRETLLANKSSTLVAEFNGRIVGFASFGKCRDEDAPQHRGEIWALYAAPEAWGQGHGRALMAHAATDLRSAGFQETSLWVLANNQRGIRFYASCGYAKVEGTNKLFELGGVQVEEACYLRQNDA